jgi:hypothetical protein
MSQNFKVTEADPRDLDEISNLLQQRSMRPSDELWQEYCQTLSGPNPTSASGGAGKSETSIIIIDKIGLVRGFCIIRRRHHPTYGRLLDVPIIALEIGPNENEIARVIFDHMMDVSRRESTDALRFGISSPKAWAERVIPDLELRLTGTIMPLGIGRRAQPEPTLTATPIAAPTRQQSVGQICDLSIPYRTNVGCSSQPWLTASA